MRSVQAFDEFEFIQKLKKTIHVRSEDVVVGIGDDAAVLRKNKTNYQLVTTDSLVENVHFVRSLITPQQLGFKAAAISLSDIAAMGGSPQYCLVSLMLPSSIDTRFVEGIYEGLGKASGVYGIDIIGGNISRNDSVIIETVMIGEVKNDLLLLRSGARPGDAVLVTGTLGNSAAGLKLLQNPKLSISEKEKKLLISFHLTPLPCLEESVLIAGTRHATAMIDISDGLCSDLSHICDASDVGVGLQIAALPVSQTCKKAAKLLGVSAEELALYGGEDYELCLTVPQKHVEKVKHAVEKETGTQLTVIGEILPKIEGRWLQSPDGKKHPLKPAGWSHFPPQSS